MKWTLWLLFGLTACQHTQPLEEPVIVKVPVSVPCNVKPVPEPEWNMEHLVQAKPTAELQAVLADLDLSKGYIEELKAELKACT